MEYSVIKIGGKQYVVAQGDVVSVEKLSGEQKTGDKIVFSEVLLVDNGLDTTIGTPTIKGAAVKGAVVEIIRAKKIDVVKYKAKSRYLKRRGHRQPFTKVRIDSIA
ncbi:MAG TPA: 50S ribosomal protein L21 [Candidatus Kaiserbacteria bacterium]|nr:50S ribosomal protein L21 [Candidatus Kaiserbacteria bacterium]